MFNAEKLLGKVVREVTGSSGMKKKKKKKKGKSSLIDNFTSGAGLMTAIGLGIGAYEILRDKSQPQTITGQPPHQQPADTMPPPISNPSPAGASQASTPPPILPGQDNDSVARPAAVHVHADIEPEQLAVRLIQVMIASAHADGTMDAKEEVAVIGRLKNENFSQEEKMFLLGEMHNPKSLDELTDGISDPAVAKTMYMLAAGVIEIDTPEERQWLNDFAARLGISQPIREFIEEQV